MAPVVSVVVIAAGCASHEGVLAKLDEWMIKHHARTRDLFMQMDIDHSGSIQANELGRCARLSPCKKCLQRLCKTVSAVRMDDQIGLVPGLWIPAYFAEILRREGAIG